MLRDADPSIFKAVYVVCGFTDMRYGIDTLSSIIQNKYKLSLFVPNTLFLFCGRKADRIKGLLWEGDGFLMLIKRVDAGRFAWPRTSDDARKISPKQFEWLMNGFAIDPVIHMTAPERSA